MVWIRCIPLFTLDSWHGHLFGHQFHTLSETGIFVYFDQLMSEPVFLDGLWEEKSIPEIEYFFQQKKPFGSKLVFLKSVLLLRRLEFISLKAQV